MQPGGEGSETKQQIGFTQKQVKKWRALVPQVSPRPGEFNIKQQIEHHARLKEHGKGKPLYFSTFNSNFFLALLVKGPTFSFCIDLGNYIVGPGKE